MKDTKTRAAVSLAACTLMTLATAAHASLPDEIQVYDDSINGAGERGLELHINTTPSGRVRPDYPGEIPPAHAWRVTPEFSWGLNEHFEAGLYVPTLLDREHKYHVAGLKLRLKWIGQRAPETGGFFYGLNAELSKVGGQYEASRKGLELRPIAGYRNADWLVVMNPVLGYDLDRCCRQGGPDFNPSLKVARSVATGIGLGLEAYSEMGKLAHFAPSAERQKTVFLALDVARAPYEFNLGIGRGLNSATDRWSLKGIANIPL